MSRFALDLPTPYHTFTGQGRYRHLLPRGDTFVYSRIMSKSQPAAITRRDMLKQSGLCLATGAVLIGSPQPSFGSPLFVGQGVAANADKIIKGATAMFVEHAPKIAHALGVAVKDLFKEVTTKIIVDFAKDALLRALQWLYEDVFGDLVDNPSIRRIWRTFVDWVQTKIAQIRQIFRPVTQQAVARALGPGYGIHSVWSDYTLANDFSYMDNASLKDMRVEVKTHSNYETELGWLDLGLKSELKLAEAEYLFGDSIFLPRSKDELIAFLGDLVYTPKGTLYIPDNFSMATKPERNGKNDVMPAGPRQPWPRYRTPNYKKKLEAVNRAYFEEHEMDAALEHGEIAYEYPLHGAGGVEFTGFGVSSPRSGENFIVLQNDQL